MTNDAGPLRPPSPVTVEMLDDGVVVVTLNQPDNRNALSPTMTGAVKQVFAELEA